MKFNQDSDTEHEQIAAVARELWRTRGASSGSPEDDWFEAEQIVRQRRDRYAASRGIGNSIAGGESYLLGAGLSDANVDFKEQQAMENTTTTSMTDAASTQLNKAGSALSGAMDRARNLSDQSPKSTPRPEHREGPVARGIEQQTAKIPSDAWLWAAVGSIGLSLALELSGREKTASFVGHWAPTLLILGLYNKLVKLQGSDGV